MRFQSRSSYRGRAGGEAWAVLSEETEFRDAEDSDERGKTAEALVSKYMEEAAPQIEPAAVEMRVEGVMPALRR